MDDEISTFTTGDAGDDEAVVEVDAADIEPEPEAEPEPTAEEGETEPDLITVEAVDEPDAEVIEFVLSEDEDPEAVLAPLHNAAEAAIAAARDVVDWYGEVLYVYDADNNIVDGPFRTDVAFGFELTEGQRIVTSPGLVREALPDEE